MKRQWKRRSSVRPHKAAARHMVLHKRFFWSWDNGYQIEAIDARLNQIVTPFGVTWTR